MDDHKRERRTAVSKAVVSLTIGQSFSGSWLKLSGYSSHTTPCRRLQTGSKGLPWDSTLHSHEPLPAIRRYHSIHLILLQLCSRGRCRASNLSTIRVGFNKIQLICSSRSLTKSTQRWQSLWIDILLLRSHLSAILRRDCHPSFTSNAW